MADTRFFKDQLSTKDAFFKTRLQVVGFFDEMRLQPKKYGIDQCFIEDAKTALEKINTLSKQKSPLLSTVLRLPPATENTTGFPMCTIFDLMGWIFSAANKPPSTADRDNYYLPLAAIYAKFCRLISMMYEEYREDPQPHMIALAYFTWNNGNHGVILGTSLVRPRVKNSAGVKDREQELRHHALVGVKLISESEERAKDTTTNAKYGHCAETWFFYFAKVLERFINMQTAEGFAMDLSVLNIDNCYDYNKLLHLLESLRDPCGNCRHIIGDKIGADVANFRVAIPPQLPH